MYRTIMFAWGGCIAGSIIHNSLEYLYVIHLCYDKKTYYMLRGHLLTNIPGFLFCFAGGVAGYMLSKNVNTLLIH